MNAPLNDDARRSGGQNRDKGRPKWEKEFMGTLAGSSRPLKKDHPAASDFVAATNILTSEAKRFPWLILALVGRDGATVASSLPEADIAAQVYRMGGAIGLAGLVFLRDRLVTFVRPFVAGAGIEGKLIRAMEDLKPTLAQHIRKGVRASSETSEKNRDELIKRIEACNLATADNAFGRIMADTMLAMLTGEVTEKDAEAVLRVARKRLKVEGQQIRHEEIALKTELRKRPDKGKD